MTRQAVCDVLNDLEVYESDLGDMPYILVEDTKENRAKLNAVGVTNEQIDKVLSADTFCILSLAFHGSEQLADDYKDGKFIIWTELVDDELRQRVLNGQPEDNDAFRLLKALEPQLFESAIEQ